MTMNATTKNVIIVLGVVTIAFMGYYLFMQEASLVLRSSESDRQLEQMLVRTQEFVSHREILDTIALDENTIILQSQEFRGLQSFSPEPNEFQVGRSNPFTVTPLERPLAPGGATNAVSAAQE